MNIDERNGNKKKANSSNETRCECGHLIAKIRGENLELKCKRCKRIVAIPYSRIKEAEYTIALH